MTTHSVQFFKVAQMDVPGPEVFWMDSWGEWERLYFLMGVIHDVDGGVALINSGPPENLDPWNEYWGTLGGEEIDTRMLVEPEERPLAILKKLGMKPKDVKHIFITPMQAYANGNLHLFPNATYHVSRRGWIEDIFAPPHKLHVPRFFFMSDDLMKYLLFEANDRVHLVGEEEEICDGIRIFWSGVHHRASQAICVDTEMGTLAATDSLFKYPNYEDHKPLGIQESMEEYNNLCDRLRREVDIVIPLYEPEVLNRFKDGKIG
jgi:glyoxylase-like metal-dependent hydrolase (beta-lactamase superfamily II)